MSLIETLAERLSRHPKRVVFPEGADPRILQAARQFATRRLGVPILLGDRTRIKENAARLDLRLDGMRIVEPARADEFEDFVNKFQGLRRFKGLSEHEARDYVANSNYFAALMLARWTRLWPAPPRRPPAACGRSFKSCPYSRG
jgi:phosphate acetyltransferase